MEITVTRSSKATKERIWSLWTNVETWNLWDPDVEYSKLFGKFEVGVSGILKARNGPKSRFKIVEATPNKSFTNRSKLPFCTLDFIHEVIEKDRDIIITHRIVIKGLLSPLFSKIIGKQQELNLPKAVDELIKFAENE
ncbi:MAG TPA: hypothetical protein K8W04_04565 [Bacteroides reticulotermitis]|nr:hypothetical protein [Bacteroides reticulotermitis]